MQTVSKKIRDNFIAAISYTGIPALYRVVVRRGGPLVRVVVFHDVKDAEWFDEMLSFLSTQYHVVTPAEFLASQFNPDKINILVTFDDGYASWVRLCMPHMSCRRVTGIFFANSGLLDVSEDMKEQAEYVRTRLMLSPRETLSWEGLAQLHIEGHMIGGHTVGHKRLSTLSEELQGTEILEDRNEIENHLGCKPEVFAYPFGNEGDYTKETQEIVCAAGYTRAFDTRSAFADPFHKDPYAIPRLCIEDGLSTTSLKRWIEGGYDVYRFVKRICVR